MNVSFIYTPLQPTETKFALELAGCDFQACYDAGYLNESVNLPARGSKPICYNNLFDVLRGALCWQLAKGGYQRVNDLADTTSDCLAIAIQVCGNDLLLSTAAQEDFLLRLREETECLVKKARVGLEVSLDELASMLLELSLRLWRILSNWFRMQFDLISAMT